MPNGITLANADAQVAVEKLTRAMAGPNPFHRAFTPSTAIVFRAQSKIPAYVPVGADCNLDFRT